MNIRQIMALLRTYSETGREAPANCLEPRRIAAYHDAQLGQIDRASVERHLARCDRCLGQLAALSRASEVPEEEFPVPDTLTARAQALVASPAASARKAHWRMAVPLAAAAMLLLAINLVGEFPPTSRVGPEDIDSRQTRNNDRSLLQPRLLAPAEGSAVMPSAQVFHWTEVPGTLFYDVRLVSLDGDLLLRERVAGTRWVIPDNLSLEPGEEYFVRVDAYLNDAKYLSSEHRVFRVGDTP